MTSSPAPAPSTGSGTPTPAPPAVRPPSVGKLTLKATRLTSKSVRVEISVAAKPTGRTAIRLRLMKGKTQVATVSAEFNGKTLRVTLKSKRASKRGTYKLVATISQAGALPAAGRADQECHALTALLAHAR